MSAHPYGGCLSSPSLVPRGRLNARRVGRQRLLGGIVAQSHLPVGGREARSPARRPATSTADRSLLRKFQPFRSLTDCACHGGCDRHGSGHR